jgi:DNA repair exonuclease SbcCD ATPase subunit
MALSEILSSLKTFTWSFSVGYKPAKLSAVALDEDGARNTMYMLLFEIAEKNKEYIPLQKHSRDISSRIWKLSDEKRKIEDVSKSLQWFKDTILRIQEDFEALQNEQSEQKRVLEQRKHKFEMKMKDFESDEFYSQKISQIETDVKNLQKEENELNEKLREIRKSIETNNLIGPYTFSLMDVTFDFESSCGKSLKEIVDGPPSDVTPFCFTTIFSALDG